MKQAIVYCSKTGNTKLLANVIGQCMENKDLVYMGEIEPTAQAAKRLYIGFWTDKGCCSDCMLPFLNTLHDKELFIFGTAGFGGEQAYFDRILANVVSKIPHDNTIIGTFMCQGKMPSSIRERYVKLAKENKAMEKMVENFDQALIHPNQSDFDSLTKKIQSL